MLGQFLQQVGRGFQRRFFALQTGYFERVGRPIEFAEIFEFHQLGQHVAPLLQVALLGLQCSNLATHFTQPGFQHPGFCFQRFDLGLVAPAQHIVAAVVQAVAVVFLMALATGLDLAVWRDGFGLGAKLLLGDAAGNVKAARYLGIQPGVER